MRALWAAATLIGFFVPAFAANHLDAASARRGPITIPREPGTLTLDRFILREPRDGMRPSRATTVFLHRDDRNLHVRFECEAPPREIRAHMAKREQVGDDDAVGVFIDTANEGRTAYFFYSNARGVQMDGITKEGQGEDASFDTVFSTRGEITSTGFTVQFVIPFRAMRAPDGGPVWALAFTRYSPHTNELSTWPRISRAKEGFVPHFASFEAPIEQASRMPVTITPYLFASAARQRAGADIQLAIRNQFDLGFTVNPDFSQVESDDLRGTVNQRFEVFFPEKRPFFRDHANYFQTPEMLLFSRRIVTPGAGARFTGSAGGWSGGALEIDDTAFDRARIHAGRLERSFGTRGSLGGIFLERDTASSENRVAAADGRWRFGDHWVAAAQAIRTSYRTDGRARTGSGSYFNIRRAGNGFHMSAVYRDRSPEFRDELGYIPRVGLRQTHGSAGYSFRPESRKILAIDPSITYLVNHDWQGRLTDWSVAAPLWIDLPRSTSLSFEHEESFEMFDGTAFRKRGNSLSAASDPESWASLHASVRWGGGVNYAAPRGIRPFAGRQLDYSAGLTVRPGARLRIDHSLIGDRLDSSQGLVYSLRIARIRVQYQFTRQFSVRLLADRNSLSYDSVRMTQAPLRPYSYDVLAAWESLTGLCFYGGYANRRRRFDILEERTGAIAYVKLAYQFRP